MPIPPTPFLILVMGVSGCGKSTLAEQLAKHFDANFLDADDFHSDDAKHLMASGTPLTDAMREPWVARLADTINEHRANNHSCVLAFSGLKKKHRQSLQQLGLLTIGVLLSGSKEVIAKRLATRGNHFFDPNLIDSQFASLETPDTDENIIIFNTDLLTPLPKLVSAAIDTITPLLPQA